MPIPSEKRAILIKLLQMDRARELMIEDVGFGHEEDEEEFLDATEPDLMELVLTHLGLPEEEEMAKRGFSRDYLTSMVSLSRTATKVEVEFFLVWAASAIDKFLAGPWAEAGPSQ